MAKARIAHLWVKPPNEEWLNHSETIDPCYTISARSKEELQCYFKNPSYVPGMYQEVSAILGRYVVKKGYEFEWRFALDKKWRERESNRFLHKVTPENERYTPLPKEWNDLEPIEDHFAHIAMFNATAEDYEKKSDYVAFTESPDKGERDVQTRMRAGKYVKKFYPHLSNEEVRRYASAVQSLYGLQLTDDPIEASEVYEKGPHSCMRRGPNYWPWEGRRPNERYPIKGVRHPVCAYFAGDLKLAYLGPKHAATARCIVWPEKKLYGRIYGAHAILKAALHREGYTCAYDTTRNVFPGARLNIVRYDTRYVIAPYFDSIAAVCFFKDTKEVRIGTKAQNATTSATELYPNPGEKGLWSWRDPYRQFCALSEREITVNDPTVPLYSRNEPLVALRTEAVRQGYLETEEGWCFTPYVHSIDGELVIKPYVYEDYRLCRDGVYYHADVLVCTFDGSWAKKDEDLILYKGSWFRDLPQLYRYFPEANPCPNYAALTPEENEVAIVETARWMGRSTETVKKNVERCNKDYLRVFHQFAERTMTSKGGGTIKTRCNLELARDFINKKRKEQQETLELAL